MITGLGRPLEEGMGTHSVFLPGESPWTEEPGGLQSMGSQRVGHDRVAKHSTGNRRNILHIIPGRGGQSRTFSTLPLFLSMFFLLLSLVATYLSSLNSFSYVTTQNLGLLTYKPRLSTVSEVSLVSMDGKGTL